MPSSPDESIEQQLLTVIRDHDIPIKRADLVKALEDDDFRAWASTYLKPDNLLSKEELEIYTNLESTGVLKVLQAQQQRHQAIRPLLDAEVQSALEKLQDSTAATERQTEILKKQWREMQAKTRDEAHTRSTWHRSLARLDEKHGMEKQRGNRDLEDLINNIEMSLAPAEAAIAAERSAVLPQVSGLLKENDRILECLEYFSALDPQAETDVEHDRGSIQRAKDLATALMKYMSETVKARLDRTYLEGLQSTKADESNAAAKQASTEAEMDIATLYADIDDLVTMTVQQCYERPLVQALRDRQSAQQSSSARELDIAFHALEQITSSLAEVTERLRSRQSHRVTLDELAFRFREELAEHHKKAAGLGDKGSATKGRDWQAKRLSVGGLGSVSNRSGTSVNSRKPGSGSHALDLLLKQQGLSPLDLFNSDGASDPMARAQMILQKRKEELIASLEKPDSLAESPLLSHLQSANTALQLIADSLCADTRFKPSLTDEEQDGELERLEKGVEALRKRLDSLSIDSLYKKDPLREEFLRRWGDNRNEKNDVDTF